MPHFSVSLTVEHLYHVSLYTNIKLCSHEPFFVTGADGFMYQSVAIGTHSVTVRGTAQDGQSNEVTLSGLNVTPNLNLTVLLTRLGTTITVIIEANKDATFECQLDNLDFEACKCKIQQTAITTYK